MSLASPKHQGV